MRMVLSLSFTFNISANNEPLLQFRTGLHTRPLYHLRDAKPGSTSSGLWSEFSGNARPPCPPGQCVRRFHSHLGHAHRGAPRGRNLGRSIFIRALARNLSSVAAITSQCAGRHGPAGWSLERRHKPGFSLQSTGFSQGSPANTEKYLSLVVRRKRLPCSISLSLRSMTVL